MAHVQDSRPHAWKYGHPVLAVHKGRVSQLSAPHLSYWPYITPLFSIMSSNANGSNCDVETPVYFGAGEVELEKGRVNRHIERVVTPGGHPVDFSQPAIPVQHRKFGNPLPAGLLSFATGFWVVGLFTLQARGVKAPHVVFPLLST